MGNAASSVENRTVAVIAVLAWASYKLVLRAKKNARGQELMERAARKKKASQDKPSFLDREAPTADVGAGIIGLPVHELLAKLKLGTISATGRWLYLARCLRCTRTHHNQPSLFSVLIPPLCRALLPPPVA
jgi:hypothetical protein